MPVDIYQGTTPVQPTGYKPFYAKDFPEMVRDVMTIVRTNRQPSLWASLQAGIPTLGSRQLEETKRHNVAAEELQRASIAAQRAAAAMDYKAAMANLELQRQLKKAAEEMDYARLIVDTAKELRQTDPTMTPDAALKAATTIVSGATGMLTPQQVTSQLPVEWYRPTDNLANARPEDIEYARNKFINDAMKIANADQKPAALREQYKQVLANEWNKWWLPRLQAAQQITQSTQTQTGTALPSGWESWFPVNLEGVIR